MIDDNQQAAFPDGTLWQLCERAGQRARKQGALQPIRTHHEFIEDRGLRFQVHLAEHLGDKPRPTAADQAGTKSNPFLPYDPRLFVAHAGDHHVCLLNKYPVVDHHLLLVTRAFEPQQECLNEVDFAAWWRCLNEFPSLGFYNSDQLSGASQPHKHMQLVPLRTQTGGWATLLDQVLDRRQLTLPAGQVTQLGQLPFVHAVVRTETADAGERCQLYRQLLTAIHRAPTTSSQPSYNLLLTHGWMLAVPRTAELWHGISLNAMAFAGGLLVRDASQRDVLRQHGPIAALQFVSG